MSRKATIAGEEGRAMNCKEGVRGTAAGRNVIDPNAEYNFFRTFFVVEPNHL